MEPLSIEEETLAEVAKDLHLEVEALREALATWLGQGCVHPSLPPEYNAACYSVYRLVKQKSAFRGVVKSRQRWRDAAMAHGITTVASRPQIDDWCQAVIFHGPGHQSKTRCRVKGEHDLHEAVYGGSSTFAQWRGDEAMTGFFDEPPEDDDHA